MCEARVILSGEAGSTMERFFGRFKKEFFYGCYDIRAFPDVITWEERSHDSFERWGS